MSALLSVSDIHTYYGDSYVLHGLSIHVDEGETLGILGRNGMGKTTLINSIMGFVPPRRGAIHFRGEDITTANSFDISKMGIGLCPQGRRVFPTLSVRENLLVAQQEHDVGYRWDFKEVYELFPRLGERADQRAGSLSGGEQQMLAVGRALMTNPSCLIMDEPSEGTGAHDHPGHRKRHSIAQGRRTRRRARRAKRRLRRQDGGQGLRHRERKGRP